MDKQAPRQLGCGVRVVLSRWLDIGEVVFCVFMDRVEVMVHKYAKKHEGNIQPSGPNKLGQ